MIRRSYEVVASQRSVDEAMAEAPASSAPNSCPNNLESISICTEVPASPPSAQDGGDLHPGSDVMGNQELSSAKLTEAVVLALLTSRKDDGTQLEIMLILVFSSTAWALFFFVNPLMCGIFFVNVVVAYLLPTKWVCVPVLCFASSLLIRIIAPGLP